MDVVRVEGLNGPLEHLIASVWKDDDNTYRILLDNPVINKFLVIFREITIAKNSISYGRSSLFTRL